MNERNETTVSASREKKNRQGLAGQELTEKQIKAQQEAAQAKRNAVIYTIMGVVCAVLVAALLIWNSGFFQNRAPAVTIDGESYSVGDMDYYYNQVLNTYYMYAQYGLDVGFDINKDLSEQMYDAEKGITWHDQLLDEAIDAMKQTKVLVAQAKAAGVELSEEGAHEIEHAMKDLAGVSANNGFATVNSYLKAAYGESMNKGKYEKILKEEQLAYEYQLAYTESLTYTEEELQAYYEENKDSMDRFDYNYAFFEAALPEEGIELEQDYGDEVVTEVETDTDTDTEVETDADADAETETDAETVAAMADALKQAEALKAQLTSQDFAAAVEQYAENESVTIKEERGVAGANLNSAYAQWLQEEGRKEGDVTVMVDSGETGYFVVEYLGRGRDEEKPGDVRHILVAAEQNEGAAEPTEEQYEAAKVKAEALLEQWKSGAATEESFAELAKTESADPGSAEQGGLYEMVYSGSGFITEFTDWVMDPARQAKDTGLVKNTGSSTKGWHIMYYVNRHAPVWQLEAEYALASEASDAWLEELLEAAQVTKLDALKNVK